MWGHKRPTELPQGKIISIVEFLKNIKVIIVKVSLVFLYDILRTILCILYWACIYGMDLGTQVEIIICLDVGPQKAHRARTSETYQHARGIFWKYQSNHCHSVPGFCQIGKVALLVRCSFQPQWLNPNSQYLCSLRSLGFSRIHLVYTKMHRTLQPRKPTHPRKKQAALSRNIKFSILRYTYMYVCSHFWSPFANHGTEKSILRSSRLVWHKSENWKVVSISSTTVMNLLTERLASWWLCSTHEPAGHTIHKEALWSG